MGSFCVLGSDLTQSLQQSRRPMLSLTTLTLTQSRCQHQDVRPLAVARCQVSYLSDAWLPYQHDVELSDSLPVDCYTSACQWRHPTTV